MEFRALSDFPEVVIIEPQVFEDGRGFFMEMYHRAKFEAAGIHDAFVQDNRSKSCYGALRGLHYQVNKPQAKLVWTLSGEIFDVVVDIRRNSPQFGQWAGIVLSDKNKKGVYIPPDFAHGFCVLSQTAEVFYKCTEFYAPEHERCFRWNDPDLAIDWPVETPVLSERDAGAPFFRHADLPS